MSKRSKGNVIWARLSTYQFPHEKVDQTLDQFNEALGSLAEPGLKRAELLVDRESDNDDHRLGERALQASVDAANRIRSGAADASGASILDVQQYELVRDEAY